MCTGRLLLIYEEHMPPGAASGGERGAGRAESGRVGDAAAVDGLQSALSGRRFCVALPLWCTPGSAGGRVPLARAEMRLAVCQTCRGTGVVTDAIRLCIARELLYSTQINHRAGVVSAKRAW